MSDLKDRLTSRKFLLTILAVLIALANEALGLTPEQLQMIQVVIVAFIGAEGVADAFGRFKPTAKTDPVPAPAAPSSIPATPAPPA